MAVAIGEHAAGAAHAGAGALTRPALGVVNLLAVAALGWGLWVLLLDPNGVLKLYTPMYGFSLVAVLAAVLVAMGPGAEGWPLRAWRAPAPVRGLVAAAVAVALTAAVVHGFFWGFLGRYGVTYFSPQAIVAAGGVGAEFFNARENASTAIVYLSAAFLWTSLVLSLGFGAWPWEGTRPGVRAFSRLSVAALLAVLVYAVLFHPHVAHLFFPAQTMAGVPPWWAEFAQTGSAYFNLGWTMCAIAVLVVVDVVWEGAPWRVVGGERGWARGLAALAGSTAVGAGAFAVALRAMTGAWGEAFQGGQYTDAPYFRHLHAAEVAGFVVLAAFALDVSFGPPQGLARRAVRTAVIGVAAALLHLGYYTATASRMLGKVPGVGQPEDTPLVLTLLLLALVLVQREFLGRWPLRTERA